MARILIIDDDEEMSSLLRDFLRDDGYEADFANNGGTALRKISQKPFDLVVTDFRMPGLTGLDILPEIKRLQPAAFVMVITAFGSEDLQRRSLEEGADAYVEKPIRFHKLKILIAELLSSRTVVGFKEKIRPRDERKHMIPKTRGNAENDKEERRSKWKKH